MPSTPGIRNSFLISLLDIIGHHDQKLDFVSLLCVSPKGICYLKMFQYANFSQSSTGMKNLINKKKISRLASEDFIHIPSHSSADTL